MHIYTIKLNQSIVIVVEVYRVISACHSGNIGAWHTKRVTPVGTGEQQELEHWNTTYRIFCFHLKLVIVASDSNKLKLYMIGEGAKGEWTFKYVMTKINVLTKIVWRNIKQLKRCCY